MTITRWLAIALTALLALTATAAEVRVLGLFEDRALLMINGKQHFLKAGEQRDGVKLIRADSAVAVLDIDGKRGEYGLNSDIHTSFSAPERQRVQIARDTSGMFSTAGAINGVPVRLMVDTGATNVAMDAAAAERLGLPFRHEGKPVTVQTAAGPARAWLLNLRSVRVGDIERSQVSAVIIEAKTNGEILLGMSFLSTVKMEKQSNLLVLEAQY